MKQFNAIEGKEVCMMPLSMVTAEEHSVIGGLGSAVAETIVKKRPVKMEMVGQHDTYGESGKPEELKKKYGMTSDDIVTAVKNVL